jgi:hypothetical protein
MHVLFGSTNLSTLGGQTGTSYVSSFASAPQESPRGQVTSYRTTMTVAGEVCVDNSALTTLGAQDAVNTAITALENLLDGGLGAGQSLGLVRDDGDFTRHVISVDGSLGGVRIDGLTYSDSGPAEYVTGRKWQFTASVITEPAGVPSMLDYRETVQVSGGGPRYAWSESAEGPAVRYTTADVTVGTLIQSGTVLGRQAHVELPLPLYPVYEEPAERSSTEARPLYVRGVFRGYQRSWRYVHRRSGGFVLPAIGGL